MLFLFGLFPGFGLALGLGLFKFFLFRFGLTLRLLLTFDLGRLLLLLLFRFALLLQIGEALPLCLLAPLQIGQPLLLFPANRFPVRLLFRLRLLQLFKLGRYPALIHYPGLHHLDTGLRLLGFFQPVHTHDHERDDCQVHQQGNHERPRVLLQHLEHQRSGTSVINPTFGAPAAWIITMASTTRP